MRVVPPSHTHAQVSGMGIALPEQVVKNSDLEKRLDTSDEWIVTRTGIRERRIADKDVATSDLCIAAAEEALRDAEISASDLDLVVICTVTPDNPVPATACMVQNRLGAKKAGAFDLSAGCTGFMYGLAVGSQFIETGFYQRVLVIGADMLSRITNWEDRSTAVLFGDGAGAFVLTPSSKEGYGLLKFRLKADGSGAPFLMVEAGGTRIPASEKTVKNSQHYLKMEGRPVFKFAVNAILDGVLEVLKQENLTIEDIDCFIFHQANVRILENAAKQLKIPMEKVFTNVERYGNTSSASVPLALYEARQEKKFKRGSYVLMVGYGAGLTWGSALMRW
jgi:3-oxoacyl-[acyl-carrier-protein] synthase-3